MQSPEKQRIENARAATNMEKSIGTKTDALRCHFHIHHGEKTMRAEIAKSVMGSHTWKTPNAELTHPESKP
jgi:hypothetical protein